MEDVAKACCDFLTKHLEPANVIGIARFAEEIGCTELHQWSREYINTHFSEVRCKYERHTSFSLQYSQFYLLLIKQTYSVFIK